MPQKSQTIDQADLGGEKALDKDGGADGGASGSRPGSSRSNKLKKRRRTELPFGFGADSETAVSAIGLPSPHAFGDSNYANLRQYASNPNIGAEWKNGSTHSLALSNPVDQAARPNTSKGEKPKLDRIEIPLSRTASPVSIGTPNIMRTESPAPMGSPTIAKTGSPISITSPNIPRQASPVSLMSPKSAVSVTSKSPLGQFELKLNLPNEGTSLFEEKENVLKPPEPLRIVKKGSSLENPENQVASSSTRKPPSPPQSIRADESDQVAPILSLNSLTDTDRSSTETGVSLSHLSADLDDEFRELTKELDYGAKSIPTPPASVHQGHEGGANNNKINIKDNYALFDELEKPIPIKTVVAKRDTLTINTPRRMSMEMQLEKHPITTTAAIGTIIQSDGPELEIPPKSSARAFRPAALNLNLRPAAADMNGPRSAPFPTNRPPWTPLGPSPLGNPSSNPNQVQVGPRFPSRLLALRTFDDDTHEHEMMQSPLSPESPVMPLSGPLASIRLGSPGTTSLSAALNGTRSPPIRRHTEPEEDPEERIRNFRFPDPQAPPARSLRLPSPTSTTNEEFPRLEDNFGNHNQAEKFPSLDPFPTLDDSASPTASIQTPVQAFAPLKRVPTTENVENWPLGPPSLSKAAMPMTMPQEQAEQPEPDLEPLQPPRMPAAFAESSTNRARSFSRPWTPTNEPLKFEITTPRTTAATTSSPSTGPCTGTPKTTTFPILTGMPMVASPVARTASASPHMQTQAAQGDRERSRSRSRSKSSRTQSPRYAPPPRSPPIAAVVGGGAVAAGDRGLGLRSPGIVGDDFGGGFI